MFPSCPTYLAAFTLMPGMCRDTVPEGGTPGPLTYVQGCVDPLNTPQRCQRCWMCWCRHTWAGRELLICTGLERCPGLFPALGSKGTSQSPGVHLRASPKLGSELSVGPSFLPAHMPPSRALAGAFSIVQAMPGQGWRQCPVQILSLHRP